MVKWFHSIGVIRVLKITIENAISNLPYYQNFIPLNYRKMIEESPGQFTVLGARSKDRYAGLIIAKKYKKASLMVINYLVASEWNKNTGLEEMFLYLLEDIASVEKIQHIHYEYSGERNEYFQYIGGLLRKNNWSSLRPSTFHYVLHRNAIVNELRYNNYFNSNHELIFFEWGLYPSNKRFEIIEGEEKWFPKNHSLFADAQEVDKSSLGVRLDGEVIGWFLIQRVDPQTIMVKSIYLKEEFRSNQNSTQLLIMGLMQALKLPNWQIMMLHIDDDNKQLQLFVDRVLRRAIQNKSVVYQSKKRVL